MITLTDYEQKIALRAVRYALQGLRARWKADDLTAEQDPKGAADIDGLVRTAQVLERCNDNGMWRCMCPMPWRHPTCLVCPTCGSAVPS